VRAATGLAYVCLGGTVAVGVALGLEALLYLSPAAKTLALVALLLAAGVGLLGLCVLPLVRRVSLEGLALEVEAHYGGLQQILISAVQLHARLARGETVGSEELAQAALSLAGERSDELDFTAVVSLKRLGHVCMACAVGAGILGWAFWSWPETLIPAAGRLAHPRDEYLRPTETHLVVHPEGAQLLAGEPFELKAEISGVVPQSARLEIREMKGTAWTHVQIPVRRNRLRHRIEVVSRPFVYRLRANDALSPTFEVSVLPRPMVRQIRVDYTYPRYTRQAARKGVPGGNVVAPEGTRVQIQIESSLPLEEAWVAFDDGRRANAVVESCSAALAMAVDGDMRYTVGLVSRRMVQNRDPVEYRIVALKDRPPEVRLLKPDPDAELDEQMSVAILAEAEDDHGIAQMELRYRTAEDGSTRVLPVSLDSAGARAVTVGHVWDLSGFGLLPGDQVSGVVRAYDANDVSGPGTGDSRRFRIRFPSLFEIHQQALESQESGRETLESARRAAEALEERLDDISRDLRGQDEVKWQQREEASSALEAQSELANQLKEASKALGEALDRLDGSGLAGPETLRKLEEIQTLLAQMDSPALKEAASELREALSEADPAAVMEALSALRDNQEALGQSLDRTLSLLKRVQRQQALDALLSEVSSLADGQNDIAEALRHTEMPSDLADREASLAEDARKLPLEADRAAKQLASEDPTGEELALLAEEVRAQRLGDRMSEVVGHLSSNARTQAQAKALDVARDLDALREKVESLRDRYIAGQKSEVAQNLRRVLHDLMSLSVAQESAARPDGGMSSQAAPPHMAMDQARSLAGAERLAVRLMEAAQKTFLLPPQTGAYLGEAMAKIGEAAERFQNGNIPQARGTAQKAMGALNQAALGVREALAELKAAGSAVGLDEMLERMLALAEQQADLNAQTGEEGGGQMPGGFGAMAARQEAIRQALEALRRELGAQQRQVLGDLSRIASEMGEVSRDLQRGAITPETRDRQRRILSRMLDAQRSLRARGWSRQREARPGGETAYRGPGDLPARLGESQDPLRERLRDALGGGYPPEYRELIRRYFEFLIRDATRQESNPDGAYGDG